MGYSIQPIQIWIDGQAINGNYIEASIVNDNLSNYAQFYWVISNSTTNVDGSITKQAIDQGNTTISGNDYVIWGETTDVNYAAYQYICSKLNLTLIP